MRLQHCHAAAAAATAIITVVLNWSLLCAFPPTSRRCYRSTITASHVRLIMRILLVSFFLPSHVPWMDEVTSDGHKWSKKRMFANSLIEMT